MFTGRRCGGTATRSWPSRRICPPVGCSNPAIIRSVVVLPHPDGPSSEKNSPGSMRRSMSSTATTSSKLLARARPARSVRRAWGRRRRWPRRPSGGTVWPDEHRTEGYSGLTHQSVRSAPPMPRSTRRLPERAARRAARAGPHAARAAGTPTRRTTSASSTPSSAGSGSASAAPTTSPRPVRTWRRASAACRCSSCATTRATLRAFLNVCRHRGSPLAERLRSGPRPVVPVSRLGLPPRRVAGAGRRRRAAGGLRRRPTSGCVRSRSRRSPARSSSTSIPTAAPFDPGPLGGGLEPYRLDELELGERTRYERHFNWKVLLENYCENYHTPFIHSQLPTAGYEYPIECAGPAVFAWDRPLAPRDRVGAGAARSPPGRRRAGRPSPTLPPRTRSTTAPTWRCSRTRRSRASPGSPPRSG